jgi:threonine aldolase
MGSVLCGTRKFIRDARRWRKMLGGGWRQAGIVASAGLYALEHNIERLVHDHNNALLLSKLLENIDGLTVDRPRERTNMVFVTVPEIVVPELTPRLRRAGILISGEYNPIRLVTHLDIDEPAIYRSADAFRHALSH